MRLASWNVNSIRARKDRLAAWVHKQEPDVLCLQELKCTDEQLAELAIGELGYHVVASCQKTYNGVAILSKAPPSDVVIGLGDDAEPEPQARLVAATVGDVRVICVYVPNGQAPGTDKYAYKLHWLQRLRAFLDARENKDAPIAVCGDFNVAPEARDVHDPAAWEDTTLFHPTSRAALREVMAFGLEDAFRLHHEEAGLYSWWDYQMLGFPKNRGLRIDLVLTTPALSQRVTGSFIDREERKGKQPSDHAPVVIEFT